MDYTPSQLCLARHIIGWSHTPPSLTDNLPTTIPGSQLYFEIARTQQDGLLLALGAAPRDVRVFRASGAPLDSFFRQQRGSFPWMDDGLTEEAVLADLNWMDGEIGRLRNVLNVWTSHEVAAASEHTLSPLTSVRGLNALFSGYSAFATDMLAALSMDLAEGIRRFYDTDERRRRGLNPPSLRRISVSTLRPVRADPV